jgi:DNA-binding SARP family transcriptional activator
MGTLSAVGHWVTTLLVRLVKAGLLVAILTGIPYGLATQIGSPLPDTVPTTDQISHALTSPVSDTMVLDLLAIALWILWTAFLVTFAVEILAAVRGVPAPRLRPIAPLQTLTGWLVAGVTASILVAAPVVSVAGHMTPATANASPSPAATPTWATHNTPATTTASTVADLRHAPAPARVAAQARGPVYRVARNDWMVAVAERFLGSRDRYVEIERLNPQYERRDARFPDHWEATWEVVLPADAADRGQRPHATGDLLVTGQPAPPPADPPPPSDPSPAPTTAPPTPSPSASSSQTPGPSASPSAATTAPTDPDGVVIPPSTPPTATASPSTAGPDPTVSSSDAPAEHSEPDDDAGVTLPGGWVSLPLAAALVAAGAMVWLRRRHRYRPPPVDAADVDDSDLRPLPPPVTKLRRAVRERAPELLDPPPPPPTVAQYASGDGDWQPPPIGPSGPELTGIGGYLPPGGLGLAGPGAEAAARALLVAALSTGNPDDPDAKSEVVIPAGTLTTLLGAHAVEIGPIPRLHVTSNLPNALSQLLQLVVNRQRTLQENDADDFDSMRNTDPYHPPMPPVVLLADVPSGEQRAELTNSLYLGAALKISAALLGDWPRGETRTVRADGHTNTGGERLAVLDVPTTVDLLQMLREAHTGEPTATGPVEEAPNLFEPAAPAAPGTEQEPCPSPQPTTDAHPYRDAGERAAEAEPDTAVQPAAAASTDTADAGPQPREPAAARVRIQLLGAVTIFDHDGAPAPALRMHARQLLVYLAAHRGGAALKDIMEVIWPNATLRRAGERLQTEVGDLRGKIRQAAGDEQIQPVINTGGRYHLNADLLDIDLWRLLDALRKAAAATDLTIRITALGQAVDADTGDLSAGFDYDWIDRPREQLRRQAFRARLHLADLVAGTDPQHATDLAKTAATLEPYNEDVARQVMRVLARAGDAVGIRAQLQRLRQALAETDLEPSGETIALAAQLQREISGTARPTSGETTDDPSADKQ